MAEQTPREPDGQRPRIEFAPSAGHGSGGGEIHLSDYLKVVYKRRWTALAVFLIVVMGAAVYTFTRTPMYVAKAEVLINAENPDVVSFKGVTDDQNKGSLDYYQTQYQILRSRALARRTIDALHLWNSPLFVPPPGHHAFSLGAAMGWMAHAASGLLSQGGPAEPPAADETAEQSRVINAFLQGLTISPVQNSRLVDIEYEATQAGPATDVANMLAQQYIAQNQALRTAASDQAESFLTQQLDAQRKQVEASEAALQQYREQHNALSLEDRQNIVVQKLSDLNTAVTQAKTNRLQKEALYDQLTSLEKQHQPLDTFPAILNDPYIQQEKANLAALQQQKAQMAAKLGPRHPDMIKISTAIRIEQAKLQGEIQKVVAAVKNDYLAAKAQEDSLNQALDQQKQDAMSLNSKAIGYGVLQRDAQTNRQIFESLLQRAKETGISGQVIASNVRIVDPAERPLAPAYPKKTTNMLLAMLGGLTLSLGVVFFFEYMDNRIKTPDELKAQLGLPYLGMVPALFGEQGQSLLISNGSPANFSEAFRGIRTSVLFSSAEEGGKSVAITSTGPGEGKTVVASNLAVALAQAGQRVLLIDADMRKPRVASVFGIKQEPGLSNVLVGNAQASEAVQKSAVAGLWILPCGHHPPNPSELLGARRFKDFLATLTSHFDWIILDTPPVMAVTDAAIVSHVTHGVIYVVGAEMTSRHAALRALEQLDGAKAQFVGAVLNRVDLQHNGYYYSQYYRREYAEYYAGTSTD